MNVNADEHTVEGFGHEWRAFKYDGAADAVEIRALFDEYFRGFPWDSLPPDARGFDAGCGSGRWARLVSERVGHLDLVDASEQALGVAAENLQQKTNVTLHRASVAQLPFADESMDFGYSLGVLHHVPQPEQALQECVRVLKPGAPFLVYMYYALEDKPVFYRALWRVSDAARHRISRLPFPLRYAVSQAIAGGVYWPFARLSLALERLGVDVTSLPLHAYRDLSFYVMRTDALDRFGTRLEHRFRRDQLERMMRDAGLERISLVENRMRWTLLGRRK